MRNVHECQTLVTRADRYANVDLYLNNHRDQYYWLCCEHLNPKDEGCHGSKKTIIIGSSGISATSSLLIRDLCRSLNVRLTNGGRKNTPLIIAVSSTTNEFEIYSPCSFTSLQAFVRSFGKDQTYLTRSNKWWKVYLRKHKRTLA